MNQILIFDWAGKVKPDQWGYKHNEVTEADLHKLIDFFIDKGLKVMVSAADKDALYDYLLFVDTVMFTQR